MTISNETNEKLYDSLRTFTDLEELVLLANWSTDKHREDIADLDSSLFRRKKLYKAVAEGKTPPEIMRAGALEDTSVTDHTIRVRSGARSRLLTASDLYYYYNSYTGISFTINLCYIF